MKRAIALLLLLSAVVGGCQVVPPALRGGELIVMEVANRTPRAIALVIASPGTVAEVVGWVDPTPIQAHQTVKASFYVPPGKPWAVFADGNELMGSVDVKGMRGELPMGIDIESNGSMGWWCEGSCP